MEKLSLCHSSWRMTWPLRWLKTHSLLKRRIAWECLWVFHFSLYWVWMMKWRKRCVVPVEVTTNYLMSSVKTFKNTGLSGEHLTFQVHFVKIQFDWTVICFELMLDLRQHLIIRPCLHLGINFRVIRSVLSYDG